MFKLMLRVLAENLEDDVINLTEYVDSIITLAAIRESSGISA